MFMGIKNSYVHQKPDLKLVKSFLQNVLSHIKLTLFNLQKHINKLNQIIYEKQLQRA